LYSFFVAEDTALLEKQVADLLLLIGQQAASLRTLRDESHQKSQRLLDLQRAGGKAAVAVDSSHVLRPKMRQSSAVASSKAPSQRQQPLPPVDMEAAQMAAKRLDKLREERDYWRRHFELAEKRAAALAGELEEVKAAASKAAAQQHTATSSSVPLKEIDLNSTDAESLFVKNLLRENVELKQEVARLAASGKKSVTIQEAAKDRDSNSQPVSQQKENRHQQQGNQVPLNNMHQGRPAAYNGGPRLARMPSVAAVRQPSGPQRQPPSTFNQRFPRPRVAAPSGASRPAGPCLPAAVGRPPRIAEPAAAQHHHFHTTDCCASGGGRRNDCACATCTERTTANTAATAAATRGLENQVQRLAQQNACLVNQVPYGSCN
jgi:hypothetical protein